MQLLSTGSGGRITNLADGVAPMDAVNKRQLDAAVANAGGNDPLAVKYTDSNRNTVSVGGRVANISDGVAGNDAVNVNQLNGVRGVAQDGVNRAVSAQGRADSAFNNAATAQRTADQVGTDLAALDARAVQFGTDGVIQGKGARLANLGDGVDATDAVTKRQLDALAGQVGGVVTDALQFDGTTYNATRGGVATRISGVADGEAAGDAVNRGQLDAVEGQAKTAQRTADQVGVDLAALDARAVQFTGPDGAIAAKGARVVDLADGVDATDAVNKRQLDAVAGDVANVGRDALLFDGQAYNARRSGASTRITGVADGVEDSDAVNTGQLNTVRNNLQALDQVAVKYTDNSRTAISLGDGARAVRMSNVAAGVTATDAVNKGQLDAVAADLGAVASDALMYDGQAYNATRGGHATRITGVAAGTNRTDATNFGQLDAVASIFGAGGRWANGSYMAPTFVIGGQTFTTVGDAFAAVDGRLAGIEDRVTDVEERPTSTRGVTYDDESRDAVTLEGKRGTRVSNVADGKADTDAANVRQVKKAESNSKAYTDTKTTETLQTAKHYTDTRVNDVSRGLDELGNRMERGFRETNKRISRQSAMTSAMVQMGINAAGGRSERGRLAFGMGFADGEAAFSAGYGKSFGRGSFSVGGAFSGGEASVGVGFGFDM
nr:hypothetical protein [Ancylobacter oerskovii]